MHSFSVLSVLLLSTAAFGLNTKRHGEFDPHLFDLLPEYFQTHLPETIRNDFKELTLNDALELRRIAQRLPEFSSFDQVRQAVRSASPRLDRLANVREAQWIAAAASQFAVLKPETRHYVQDLENLAKHTGKQWIQLVDRQPKEATDDLSLNYPTLGRLFYSPAGRAFAAYLRQQH
ncbi:hypothetical protein M3Y99_01544100 [Aphelenchoides fujianensis]|nr:hypothetical protein M3Y99_01544100 [Aphelenchoides fujianensis]